MVVTVLFIIYLIDKVTKKNKFKGFMEHRLRL